jgi:hypothetical protein
MPGAVLLYAYNYSRQTGQEAVRMKKIYRGLIAAPSAGHFVPAGKRAGLKGGCEAGDCEANARQANSKISRWRRK